ncbi:MAG: Rne/Rng family ribonuclease [Clostridia bacterium]|nr:Rne/Rng family ribonuclease [Clostridia bacterium]
MKKTLYFDEYCGYAVSAVTENGKLTEFNFEKDGNRSIKGNIYKGKIVNVLNGMQAAFVDCGLERNCYLSADDAIPYAEKYDGSHGEITFPELKEGDDVIVQVVKPPVGKKGAKVTLFPSFVGKTIIYLPNTPFVGVSRKIADDELRKSLAYSVSRLIRGDEGIVLRTASPYTRRDLLESELTSLKTIYQNVLQSFESAETGAVLYSEMGLLKRVLRDILSYDIEEIVVGNEKLKKVIEGFYTLFPPARRRPITVHNSGKDMLDEYGIGAQIAKMIEPRAELENGAYLVIDKCEALTAIDVNTGAFTGGDNLEQTVYYTNVLAAREIARQVKLRNIGGIVVVDFIDMASEAHNKTVVEELENALKNNGSKCSVSQMSQFGLVEFTRKREGSGALSLMCKPCSRCRNGFIKSPKFTMLETRAKLLHLYAEGHRRILLDVAADMSEQLSSWTAFSDDLKTRMPDLQIYLTPHRSYPDDQVRIRCGQFEIKENTVKLY